MGLEHHFESFEWQGGVLELLKGLAGLLQRGFAFSSTSQCWDPLGARVDNSRGVGNGIPNLSCPGLLEMLSRSIH